jgi:integrase
MATLKRNSKGDFILRFRTGGRGSKIEYHNLGAVTKGDAKDRAAEIQTEARRHIGLAEPGIKLADLFAIWKRVKAPDVAANTLKTHGGAFENHILPWFGDVRVGDLKTVTVMNYRAARLAEKKPPAPSSLNLEINILTEILNFGESGEIVRNPIRRGAIKPLAVDQKTAFFEPEEWARFIAAAESDPDLCEAAPLWRLKLLTASRIGEMMGLRWNDIDCKQGLIAIRQPKTTKKGVRVKTLTLTPAMLAVLTTVPRGIGDALVFTLKGLPFDMYQLRSRFEKTVKAAGLVGDWSPHSIRHTAATWSRRGGAPLDRVAELLGHAGLGLVRRYAHFAVADLNPALDAVSAAEARGRDTTVIQKLRIFNAGM